jgi:S1-C subfamily serine protease
LSTAETDILVQTSDALAARAEAATPAVVAVRGKDGRHVSGIAWQADLVVTSEQTLSRRRDAFDVVLSGGTVVAAAVAGRDPGTNVALLRLPQPVPAPIYVAAEPKVGALAFAYGADGQGGVSARHGAIREAGPAWTSSRGGMIDRRIALDIRLARAEEGGPVFDARGALVGMSTFGPRGRMLAIPQATIARIVPLLVRDGRVARGWLGVKLQPVEVPDALRDAAGHDAALMAMSVADGGPAAAAGVVAGDIIVAIGDAPARRLRRVLAQLGPDSIGRNLTLQVIRGGALQTLALTVAARPPE